MHTTAEATTDNVIEEIKRRLGWIETPILVEDFKKKLVEALTRPVWGKRPCRTVEIEFDEEPAVDVWKPLDKEGNIVYAKTTELDVIVCDGKRYELESKLEYYHLLDTTIVHSFKPVEVREARE
jgi:hypothetical protein